MWQTVGREGRAAVARCRRGMNGLYTRVVRVYMQRAVGMVRGW